MNTAESTVQAPQLIDILRRSTAFLARNGVESARLDAEVLLANVLDLDRIQLYVQHDRPLIPVELEGYRDALKRRARRMPVAYVTGRKEFMSLDFAVDSRVLIPRPDTEVLVEAVISRLAALGVDDPLVVDIGTGSGAIACAISQGLPGARLLATDISGDALEVAESNVARLGLPAGSSLRREICFSLQSARSLSTWMCWCPTLHMCRRVIFLRWRLRYHDMNHTWR